jgi:hypothetical protein
MLRLFAVNLFWRNLHSGAVVQVEQWRRGVREAMMGQHAWDGIEDFGTLDVEITDDWASLAHWTPAQRALKIEQDGERRQARQLAESTGRLVSRLVATMVAAEEAVEPSLAA